jgi:hypothetical protein
LRQDGANHVDEDRDNPPTTDTASLSPGEATGTLLTNPENTTDG